MRDCEDRRDYEGSVVWQWALLGSHEQRPAIVAQGPRKDLAGAGCVLIHQDGQGPRCQWLAHRSDRSLVSLRSSLCYHYGRLVCAQQRVCSGLS